jgi:hypothetical protein
VCFHFHFPSPFTAHNGSSSQLTSDPFFYPLSSKNNTPKKAKGPLIIPALKDRDWRDLARKRKSLNRYVPASATATKGKDGSVGGLGTRDTINSGPQLEGIQVRGKRVTVGKESVMEEEVKVEENEEGEEETEDQKAMRVILASADGTLYQDDPIVTLIPPRPISETDAYRQDVQEFPDEATLDDYARVPVSQFGAALLRGMGWKEGADAGNGKGRKKYVEPWIPTARPALLGIGAKEQEVFDDGSGGKGKGGRSGKAGTGRPEKRYGPLVKKDREGEGSASASAPASRRASRSPSPSSSSSRRRHHRDRDRDRDSGRDRGRERNREKNLDRDRDRERQRDSRGDGDRDGRRDHDRDRERYRDHDHDRGRDSERRG